MGTVRSLLVLSVIVAGSAMFLTLDCFSEYRQILLDLAPDCVRDFIGTGMGPTVSPSRKLPVFTKEELAKYDGSPGSPGLYLAILGRVYDVSKGERFYGPGKGYAFFAGKDGSRAFVTGKFTEEGLIDDVTELSGSQYIELRDWVKFYDKDYTLVGKVVGNFYTEDGEATQALRDMYEHLANGEKEKELEDVDRSKFPPCNSEWNQQSGGRVWCSKKSGGIERDWAGVPRRYRKGATGNVRCACVRTEGPPTDRPDDGKNQGDLGNPNLKLYKGCDEMANSCKLLDVA